MLPNKEQELIQGLIELVSTKKNAEELVKAVEKIVEFSKETRLLAQNLPSILEKALKNVEGINKKQLEQSVKDIKTTVEARLTNAISGSETKIEKALSELTNTINFVHDKVSKLTNGEDGLPGVDADEETVAQKVTDILKPEITKSSEKLQKEIDLLKEEFSKRPTPTARGGVSALGVRQAFKYIAHTEAPSGNIDGNNTTYKVKNEIFWIAGFTLNGEQIAELPNFTYAGKTITFGTALPAAYSGKDFECKYIG